MGLFGLRQVGKTTLAREIVRRLHGSYETLDRAATLTAAENAPEEFLSRRGLLCLDEAQRCPAIFPVIKDCIGTQRAPGKFLLTGSVRFTLKKEIRESLTGRILMHEVLPFTVSESHQKLPSCFLKNLLDDDTPLQREPRFSKAVITRHLVTGGMPIPCFTRNVELRHRWFENFFETLITRDLPLADPTLPGISYRQGMALLRELSLMQGQEINVSRLAVSAVLSQEATRKAVLALEALSLIDLLTPTVRGPKSLRKRRVEWKDVALWNHLAGVPLHALDRDFTALQLLIGHDLRSQIGFMANPVAWTYHRTRDGTDIPWVFKRGKKTLAMIWRPLEAPGPMEYRGLRQFVEKDPNARGIVIGTAKSPVVPLGKRLVLVPFTRIF